MRDEVAALGVPSSRIHLFFRNSLCHELRHPRFARLWREELDLRTSPAPFSPINKVEHLYGESSGVSIVPTREEYERGRVPAPRILNRVEAALREAGAALVSGHGASGKTTLAVLLAHQPAFRQQPVYYLDLTGVTDDAPEDGGLADAIAVYGDKGVLFVIDNAHLAPATAASLARDWQSRFTGASLLVLGREVRPLEREWVRETALRDLAMPAFDLVIEPDDLAGIYQRLWWRERGTEPRPVPSGNRDEWHALFGGDLIAFSAAVLRRVRDPGWAFDLSHSDAKEYILHKYIEHRELRAERAHLLTLAAVAEKEVALPAEALPRRSLESAVRHGIVWIETAGRWNEHVRFRFVHSGLAVLLLAATGATAQAAALRSQVLVAHPYACLATALRLNKIGDSVEAATLVGALWAEHRWALDQMPLSWWAGTLRSTVRLAVLDEQELRERADNWLEEETHRDALVQRALSTHLGDLASFLRYAEETVPAVWNTLATALAEDIHRDALVQRALATHLGDLARFLRYAEETVPAVWNTLATALAEDSHRDALVHRALATHLGDLASFLRYAEETMPEVWNTLATALAEDIHRDALVQRALAT
ncbi:MAG: hypothetical protein QNJ16_15945, partial [Rhodobacter sp.]|nr:hypothetical protein [Rhodobacter sp.]